jgi:hypothetical protein
MTFYPNNDYVIKISSSIMLFSVCAPIHATSDSHLTKGDETIERRENSAGR